MQQTFSAGRHASAWKETEVEYYDLENPDTYDEYFYILEAFNIGLRVQIFFPAARDCTAVLRIFLNDLNYTTGNQTEENFNKDTYNYIRNYTKLISY